MKKDLVAEFEKDGKKLIRKLNPNRSFISKKGKRENLHGRALLLNRNVGHDDKLCRTTAGRFRNTRGNS